MEKDVVAVLGVDIGPMDQMVASVLSYVGIPFVQINPRYAHQILIQAIPSKANLWYNHDIFLDKILNFAPT